jgi:hypothetical protein
MSLVIKRYIPLAITFVMGIIMVIATYFFAPGSAERDASALLTGSVDILVVMAGVIGLVVLIRHHTVNISRRGRFWKYSIFTIVGVILYLIVGLYGVATHTQHLMYASDLFSWVYNNIYVHMDMTIFSLLAFFIASAAYRAFRLRSLEASVLLIVGSLMLLGRAPIGGAVWEGFPTIATWLLNVPNTAGNRAITIGIAIGAILLAVRQLMGIERGYLGPEQQ